jgi:cytochrome c oxidase subunit 2
MGFWLALIIWAVTLGSVAVFSSGNWSLPEAISTAAREIDAQFGLTLAITGVAFVLAEGLLGWFIFKYRDRPGRTARYLHGNTPLEAASAVVVGIVFISLAVLGQKVWAEIHLSGTPEGSMPIEITGEQFAWNIRYAGADGQFGRTSPELYDPTSNPVGLVPDDPNGKDDVISLNVLAVPVGRPIELRLRSKDVLHSFFMPVLRIKQDTVPGMEIPLRFKAEKAGDYEVACAELCGLGHYRMKGTLKVAEAGDFEAWLAEQVAQASE